MNICEYIREKSIKNLFDMNSFSNCWDVWKPQIESKLNINDPSTIFNLGDELSSIFKSTSNGGRQNMTNGNDAQGSLSAGGSCWEGLVCWYLNLCLIGTRVVVIKHSKKLIPTPIADAITVCYDNFKSNTESDLVALIFPNDPMFTSDINNLQQYLPDDITLFNRAGNFNYNKVVDKLTELKFNDINICVIQCKTNWNDNAQIPMLWDMIYSGNSFSRGITVGSNGYHINPSTFKYAFVTVPTNNTTYLPNTTAVKRVRNLSGGNYWGRDTVNDVAKSIKEIITTNFSNGINGVSIRNSIQNNICNLNSIYDYFNINIT